MLPNKIFTATDLNRRSGYVLDEARLHPVTILRNERAFMLRPMEQAERQVESVGYAATMVELAVTLLKYRQAGLAVPAGNAFEWLNGVRQDAFGASFRRGWSGEATWQEFENVIHKWQESAQVARNGEPAVTFAVPAELASRLAPNPAEPAVITADLKAAASEANGARSPAEVESEPDEPESEPVQPRPLPRAWRTGSQTFFRIRRY